jgi:hypothetical protein
MCDFQKAVLCAATVWWQFFPATIQTLNLIKLQLLIEYGPETEIFQHCAQELRYVILVVH